MTDEELTPSNITSEIIEGFAQPIGFIVLNWAMIEQALVAQIEALSGLAGTSGIEFRRQGAFADRVKTMRRLLEMPELAEYRGSGRALLDQAKNMQSLRDALVHGALCSYLPSEGLLIFNRLKPTVDKDGHDISQESVRTADIQKAVNAIAKLRSRMTTLADILMARFGFA